MDGPAPTMADLIANGTLSAEVAATLWAAVDARRSFVTVAAPRFVGKTTVMDAVLTLLPRSVPRHPLTGAPAQLAQLAAAAPGFDTEGRPRGGYLVVGEFSPAPVPLYVWDA